MSTNEMGENLYRAVAAGDLRGVRKALRAAGADPNRRGNEWGDTPLHEAAASGSAECVKALLEAGAPRNAVDNHGRTPLHLAVEHGSAQCVKALVEGGARTDAVAIDRTTPLHMAASCGRGECLKALLEGGAPTDAVDDEDRKSVV